MSQRVREEMLPRLRQRYAGRGRQGRSRMIDELCEQFGYSRKHAIKLLHATAGWGCDFDSLAVKVARQNLSRNGTNRVTIDEADVLQWKPRERWNCVAANLFHDVLEAAFPKLARSLKRAGTLFISGILRTQSENCLAAGRKAGLVFDEVVTRGKWVTARGHLR